MRTIKKIHKAQHSRIGDLVTFRAIPAGSMNTDQIEPFIFLNHHGPQIYKPNNHGLPFGPHPHKGFETVTFILKGDVLHKDTQGNESIITEGGIQWMTAGSGILHSEVSSKQFKEKGGEVEILQLWINLPSQLKKTVPRYCGLQKEQIPSIHLDHSKVKLNLISGLWENKKGPVPALTDVFLTSIYFKSGGKLETSIEASRTIFLYVVKGELRINDKKAQMHNTVEFNHSGETIFMEALSDTITLFGHAMPIKERIVARGPFVMNSEAEIEEAYSEYLQGKFGHLE